jgi:Cu/Ag efflux protein CusF
MLRIRHYLRHIILMSLLALLPGTVRGAQNPARPPTKKSHPSAARTTKSANVRTGQIVALDTTAETLTLQEGPGKSVPYSLTDKTRCLKEKREAEITDFKVGDTITLRFRKSRTDEPPRVLEIADPQTALWLRGLRSKTVAVTIKEVTEEHLVAALGPDEITYVVSDKTLWSKGGQDVTSDAFLPGSKVYIVPRVLPSGAFMARAVADTDAAAAQLKERQARSLLGRLQSVDFSSHDLTLRTTAGATRKLSWNEEIEVYRGSTRLPLSVLKAGLAVRLSLKRNDAGEEAITRITLSKPTRGHARPPTGAPLSKPTRL